MYSAVIKNIKIHDGLGGKPQVGNIYISDGKIAKITDAVIEAKQEYNFAGFSVAPGFIDIQNHSDSSLTLFDKPMMTNSLMQGYTTVLLGNCGASLAPITGPASILSLQKWKKLDGVNISWKTFREYLNELSKMKLGVNVGSLIGYSTVRRGLLGDQVRNLTPDEHRSLLMVLDKSLEEGAFGVSTGLSYSHEYHLAVDELKDVANLVKTRGLLFSAHLRSELNGFVKSVHEVLDLVAQTKARTKISHFKIRDQLLQADLHASLMEIETMYQRGHDIFLDAYPYTSVWQVLYNLLPPWATEGGRIALLKSLQDPILRAKIQSEINQMKNLGAIRLTSDAGGFGRDGMTILEYSKKVEKGVSDAFLYLIENSDADLMGVFECIPESAMLEVVMHPQACIATDGVSVDSSSGSFHERCTDSSFRFLRLWTESGHALEQGLVKLTSLPARVMGLSDRGVIREGNVADLVVFGEDDLSGVDTVFVNGELSFHKGSYAANGKVLKSNE